MKFEDFGLEELLMLFVAKEVIFGGSEAGTFDPLEAPLEKLLLLLMF